MRAIKGYKDEWRVQEYLLITFFISWLAWGLLVLLTVLNVVTLTNPFGFLLFAIGGFGPTISAILCIEGQITIKKVLSFIFQRQRGAVWILLLFLGLLILTFAVSSRELNPAEPWYLLPVLFLVTTFLGGGNEELGWRGTFQPTLERIIERRIKNRRVAFVVTMIIIGLVWGLWHLPLWFVAGSTQQSMPFHLFMIMAVLLSFYIGCIYRRTGSVFYAMITHGLSNVLLTALIVKINWILITGLLIMLVLAIVLADNKKSAKSSKAES